MFAKKSIFTAFAVLALTTTALTPVAVLAKPQVAAAAAFVPQRPDPAKGMDFAHNHSDIAPDPAVKFGVLANGMHYAILKNATPPGTASMRMHINGGSLNESDDQQGLAHFLEHMAFNGSQNVAEGDMIKILERHGLAFGADTNAHTGFAETVYELDLPKVADDDLDTGLFLLRETAGNLTLDDGAIDRERGVILGEERARDTPGLHAYIKWSQGAFPGQKFAVRLPIGRPDVISSAKRERFADYYNNFYRPEQTTLVVVGDIDTAAMEAKIKAKFSDWRGNGPLRVTDYGAFKPMGVTADTYVEAGLRNDVTLTWRKPFDNAYQSNESQTRDFLDGLRLGILNERLERAAKLAETPFAQASVSKGESEHTIEYIQIDVTPKPGKDKAAFVAAYTLVRQFEAFGADQAELDRALSNYEAYFTTAAQRADTRESSGLAEGIVAAVADGDVFTSPQQDLAYFNALKPGLTLAAINSGTKDLFTGDGPFLWHEGDSLGDLDKAALLETYQAVKSAPVTAAEARVEKTWPYTDFGTPSKVTKRAEVKDLGLTQLTYANGVTATIKTTDFKADEIGITVRFAGGLLALSPKDKPPIFAASVASLMEGGLGKLDASEIKDSLTGKVVNVNFDIGDEASTLGGTTTRKDFATQMQLLMAFATDAAYREDAFERLKSFIPDYYGQLETSPNGVFQSKATALLHSYDNRFVMPSEDDFLATRNDQVKALIDHQLKTGPVEITVVGDISVAEAEAQISKTFATLAPRTQPLLPADARTVAFPKGGETVVFEHKGRADQDMSFIAWPGADFTSDTRRARAMTVLSEVMSLRLLDVVREKLGIAYSPYAGNSYSLVFPGYGYLSATAEVKPENDQAFYDAVAGIVADLRAKPITADELLRAQKPLIDQMEIDLKTNRYWAGSLPGSVASPAKLDYIRTRRDQYKAVTVEDIQRLANTYLDMSKALRIQIKPADAATAPAATSGGN